jgi:hypothetical protein
MAGMKDDFAKKFPSVQLFYYEPTYPRKHLTILLIGDWQGIIEAKKELEQEANKTMARQGHSFESF